MFLYEIFIQNAGSVEDASITARNCVEHFSTLTVGVWKLPLKQLFIELVVKNR